MAEETNENTLGEVMPKETLILRHAVGDAKGGPDGAEYSLTANFANLQPIVESKQTGKFWTIGWAQLIELAIKAGVNNE